MVEPAAVNASGGIALISGHPNAGARSLQALQGDAARVSAPTIIIRVFDSTQADVFMVGRSFLTTFAQGIVTSYMTLTRISLND